MDSDVVMKLPTIDFRKHELKLEGSEEWISVRDQVCKALEEYGCFEALLDGVPTEKLYDKVKQVFTLPLEAKFENALSQSASYTRDNPKLPLQERLLIYHALTPGAIESYSKILWPDGDLEFCELVHSYSKRLSELDEIVRKMIFEKLGIEKYLDEHMKATSYSLGLLKYRVPKPEESNVGLGPHTDKLIISILSQHRMSGLQVQKKNGQWIDIEYSSPDSVIFLANDCLKALTNGKLHSPVHQVIMGNEERYSIGFAAVPKKEGYIIKVPEELIDEDHPLLYKPFDALKYFEFCLTTKASTLESFVGV